MNIHAASVHILTYNACLYKGRTLMHGTRPYALTVFAASPGTRYICWVWFAFQLGIPGPKYYPSRYP